MMMVVRLQADPSEKETHGDLLVDRPLYEFGHAMWGGRPRTVFLLRSQ